VRRNGCGQEVVHVMKRIRLLGAVVTVLGTLAVLKCASPSSPPAPNTPPAPQSNKLVASAESNSPVVITQGEQIFRFDTFGDEDFWGGQLQLHQAVSQLTPKQALGLGLKIDSTALTGDQRASLVNGTLNLDDPNVTVALVLEDAVVGVKGFCDGNDHTKLTSIGITCALCHSTVDDSVAPSIGERLDGLANHDLNVGGIISAAPNLQPVLDLLHLANPALTKQDVLKVLAAWGPGKFDAELFLDGKGFAPDGTSGATLIPNARGLAGYNLHTWTGGWGSIPYWNAFVAVLEMHGKGTFFDERLDNAAQFPIAAAAHMGHTSVDPDSDLVTGKLPALQFYQLALPAAKPRAGTDFDADAAERGDALFSGKANCNSCHREPLWTEGGWNQHTPQEMHIDSFEADRSPGHAYKTQNLAGLFIRENGLFMMPQNKGRYYHDGRFATLLDVVNSYDQRFGLGLSANEKSDLVEYLKSL
jgi:hypothetical protein